MNQQGGATRLIRRGRAVTAVALLAVAGLYLLALRYSPYDRIQGKAFRIIYLHVAAAWSMELSFILAGIAGAVFLFTRDMKLDRFAASSAEIGMVFGTIVLTTGPIWGRGVWGIWWEWEPRLTFTLLLYLLYAGYFALRAAIADQSERARFAAVLAIMAVVLIPFIHLATLLWPSQHPKSVLLAPPSDDPNAARLSWEAVRTILTALGVFTLLYVGLIMQRVGIAAREALETADDS